MEGRGIKRVRVDHPDGDDIIAEMVRYTPTTDDIRHAKATLLQSSGHFDTSVGDPTKQEIAPYRQEQVNRIHLERCRRDPFYTCMMFPDTLLVSHDEDGNAESETIMNFYLDHFWSFLGRKYRLGDEAVIKHGIEQLMAPDADHSIRFLALCWMLTLDEELVDMFMQLMRYEPGISYRPPDAFLSVVNSLKTDIVPKTKMFPVNIVNVVATVNGFVDRVRLEYAGLVPPGAPRE